jgi:predicted nuclease of restriction endonuclease-like RecB superfamily
MNRWKKLCAQVEATRAKEMKKPPNKRLKKNLKTGPGRRLAKEYAAMAGMKSIGEVRCAADMDSKKIEWKYEIEKLRYQHKVQTYTPDFLLADGTLIEYKGKMTNETRKKLLSIKRCNPKRRLCIVFEKPDNKLSSRPNSQRYWQWAEANQFEWSDQVVDPRWVHRRGSK